MNRRYLEQQVIDDALVAKKIAFISGPRQVGKTTMAQNILSHFDASHSAINYFNWDDDEFKKLWAKSPKSLLNTQQLLPGETSYIVLDEIHKDRTWKNKLKGLYDLNKERYRFLVTGSARMDYFRKSGDSLQGRYYPYRLHPFTLGEVNKLKEYPVDTWEAGKFELNIEELLNLSGFPEPLFKGDRSKARRWQRLYRERLVKEDIRDLQNIREISVMDTLSLLLPEKVGGQLSYTSLKEDLSCSFDSILRWIEILEAVYFCYRIRPYSKNIKNSLKKEPKLFLFDWTYVEDPGKRWENFIASHLLKNVQAWTDCGLGEFELFYIRDKQKREVDFFVTKDKKPYLLLEVKSNQSEPTSALIYYENLLKPKFCFQLVKQKPKERRSSMLYPNIRVISAETFLSALN